MQVGRYVWLLVYAIGIIAEKGRRTARFNRLLMDSGFSSAVAACVLMRELIFEWYGNGHLPARFSSSSMGFYFVTLCFYPQEKAEYIQPFFTFTEPTVSFLF